MVSVCVRLCLEHTSSCRFLRDVRVAPARLLLVTICTDYEVSWYSIVRFCVNKVRKKFNAFYKRK